MNFPSKYLEEAVNELSKFPGVGRKSALRMALHLLREELYQSEKLGNAIVNLRKNIKYCSECGNISDENICNICSNYMRNRNAICIVEDLRDVMAIESTAQFNGLYHVLGGVISPMEGISPDKLNIDSLIYRVKEHNIEEIIMALSATVEGDTTAFYITKKLKDFPMKISTISKGISVGGSLEFADEITLGRSISTRIPYQI